MTAVEPTQAERKNLAAILDLARAEDLGLTVIANGPCLLVTLGFRDE